MSLWKKFFSFFLLSLIVVFFFKKTFFEVLIPFPGDLLVSEYQPFRSYSYLGYNPGAVPNKAQYFDTLREFYPWRTLVTNQLKRGELPLWNPYNFAGSPLLANYQTAVFYPLNLLYLFLNQVDAWRILIILQPLLASFFTYLYARKIGIGFYGAILASLAFAYSSYMNVWLEFNTVGHTIFWLPLILYCLENLLTHKVTTIRKTLVNKWSLLLIFALSSSLFAGHPIDFGVIFLFSLLYAGFRVFQTEKDKFSLVALFPCYLAPFLIGSVQLLPTLQLLKNSTRVAFDYSFFINKMLIQPYQLIMLFIPDFFGNPATRNFWLSSSYVGLTLSIGLTPLLFVNLLIFNFGKKANHLSKKQINLIKFFIITIIVILLLTVNTPLTQLFYKIQVPLISTSSPNKLLSLFVFSLSIAAGFGLDFYLKKSKYLSNLNCFNKIKPILPFILVFLLVWTSLKFIPQEYFKASFRNTLYSTGVLAISLLIFSLGKLITGKHVKEIAVSLLIIVTVFDLSYAFNKFNPFSPREFIFPEAKILNFLKENAGLNRFWGYGTAKIDSNIATQYSLFTPDGFDALNLRWYNEFVSTSKDGKIKTEFSHIDRSVAEIHPGYGETDLPTNQYRLRVLDMLGVKYVLDRAENPKNESTFPKERFKLVWQDEAGWSVYENLKAAPRFFLTRDVKTYQTKDEFEKIFFAEDFNPTKTILIHENDLNQATMQPFNHKAIENASVSLTTYEPNKVIFQVNTPQPAFLFLSDTFDFGWKAYINGVKTKIYKTNYAFRSVLIPSGNHQVVFIYKPSRFQWL